MLNYEQAEKRLKQFRVKDWEKSRVAALGSLPAASKAAGRSLFGRDPNGKPFKDWDKRSKAEKEADAALQKMSSKDRQRIFTTIFPKIGHHVEKGWQLFQRLPYEADYDRKG